MSQVAADACGAINWGSDSRCKRLKGHRGWHCDRYRDRWHEQDIGDDGYDEGTDRMAQRRGKFPHYEVQTRILRSQRKKD